MTTESAREKIISDILKKITRNEHLREFGITKEEIPCTGINYTAAIYLITIKSKEKGEIALFAKIAKASDAERKAMHLTEMYRRERFVYLELVKIYNDLQNKYKVPIEHRYTFPKHYASSPTLMEEAVILENLSAKGFYTPDRFEPMDWIFASRAVRKLANFHALSYVMQRENPKLFDKLIKTKEEYMYTKGRPAPEIILKYTKDRINTAMEGLSDEHAERFKAFLKKKEPNAGLMEQHSLQRRPCLIHGDYKHTNLMIRSENGKLAELCPVDYQMVHYGSPINDLMYFIFTGSDEAFRDRYYKEIFEHYYNCLSESLGHFNFNVKDIYPRQEFDEDVKERTIYGLYLGLFILPYMLAQKKPDFNKKADEIIIDSGIQYRDRFSGVVNTFVKWGYL
ncbi:hypothetical protein JYU34_001757 [Plutella xylostella]|uniref:CHK kinase-like domain-containing protein n=1 Tax=Plutella xylostella TaxID=51655 RepID=A0ABQ7R4T4_PLUXY|nr:hypothetical protein JYU34_001757 [Plutella xylostella]